MNATVVVAVIVGIFFAAGLAVGAIAVIALPVFRDSRLRPGKRHHPGGAPSRRGYDRDRPDAGPNRGDIDRDDAARADRPRWPGDSNHGYWGQ